MAADAKRPAARRKPPAKAAAVPVADEDAKIDAAMAESFPSSDAPGHAAPGSHEPAPSSGYDEEAEQKLVARRERAYAIWEREGRPHGRDVDHWDQAEAPEPGSDPWIEGP